MLKVVFDATPLLPKLTGVGFYVYNLIQSLHILQKTENFQLGIYYQPSLKKWLTRQLVLPEKIQGYSNLYMLPIPVRISNLLARFPNPILSAFENGFQDANIVHGNDYTVYPCKKSLKVMTIPDVTFIKYPNYVNSSVKRYKGRVQQSLKWTDLVITISESSKKDIVEYLQVEPNRICVTPLASRYYQGYIYNNIASRLDLNIVYDFSKPYILFVSTLEPRKNIINLIKAFNLLKNDYNIEHQLVLVGKKGWHYEPIFTAIKSSMWEQHIYHLDYLCDNLVAHFYSKADVFVYPSYYEGFGLPVLEAMTLGTPVVTSNTSSLPEVAGDAALLVDPNDPTQLADAILKVISDSSIRQELIDKGKERAKLFSWERTAKETINAYKYLMT
ncbi:MAG: glycosyltransferase family 4 protein [Aphanothece sp. CMT-3BRIN-NPC111]|jgi:glycosyltransferase involved in cell wall biosynthesis|nr:glycosyltransferase family 4 protein [Aphanothece sp. CMT-3BRIN-NPC111]